MLYEELKAYGESDFYGFHMPGHKRKLGQFVNPYQIDITEIDGFDDLHHPKKQGVLSIAQERAARIYGAEETHFLVNGSTSGILSAISGCTDREGKLLIARNCHRSVYHTVALRNLDAVYIYPQLVDSLWINGAILPEDVENSLSQNEGVQAVFVTSPTYEGVCLDVRAMAEICHHAQVPLIVDQAHGAHFPFSEYFPEDAISAGADVVIHSVHKTLPSMTQTALLHIQGSLADREKIRYYLSVYQSSSPSYVLMASIDSCMELLEQKGKELFEGYVQRLEKFRGSCRDLKNLTLVGEELKRHCQAETGLPGISTVYDYDCSKLLISTKGTGITGNKLADLLRERYHLQMEMETPAYLMGISAIADTEEGFQRLSQALHELDVELTGAFTWDKEKKIAEWGEVRFPSGKQLRKQSAARIEVRQGMALESEKEPLELEKCEGRISGSYVYLYPPGIPLLVPGEVISPEIRKQIEDWKTAGLEVHGLAEDGKLSVLK